MKCLSLSAKRYSLDNTVKKGFASNNIEVRAVDYEDFFSKRVNGFVRKYESLPKRIKDLWKREYIARINQGYLKEFRDYKPDLVYIYNNQNILPWVVSEFKKSSKIVFMLGDNPLYTPTNIYNLHILTYADYIIAPDSLWCEQLRRMGIQNVYFDCFSFDPDVYHPINISDEEYEKNRSDMVYIGTAHKNNWGYKRFLFLNQFKKFDIKIYMSGDGYKRHWQNFFPELGSVIVKHDRFDQQFNNLVYNCSKISPVELVPSLFNGVHFRVSDVLGSGIFPLCEYSSDLGKIFDGIDVPFIKDYREAETIGEYILSDEEMRKSLITRMRHSIIDRFSGEKVIKRMLERIYD